MAESHWKHHKFIVLVGLHEVVHKIGVEQSLDDSCDERGPNYVLPSEDPELWLELPMQNVEAAV